MNKNLKKSAIDLTELAISVILLGVAVSIGGYVLITGRDSRLTDLSTYQTVNESVVINSTAADTLANTWGSSVDICIGNVTGVGNTLVNGTIPTSNYTVSIDGVDGVISLVNATGTTYPDAECTYTSYNTSRADWQIYNDASIGLGEYGNWFKIIVIVGVAAVVLSLIFMAFGNKGQGAGISY